MLYMEFVQGNIDNTKSNRSVSVNSFKQLVYFGV